jgi:hypothetical protein
MIDPNLRLRAKRKLIKVSFPNGKTFCYANASATMIETLKEIGEAKFPLITLEMCHLPLLSHEIYPRYKNWMKPISEGWYINMQSDTDTKFLQLKAINEALQLGLTIELGENLTPQDNPNKTKGTKSKEKLQVTFPDGEIFENDSSMDTFLEVIRKIGVGEIARKQILWCGRQVILPYQENNRQVAIDATHWIVAPTTTKDRAKLLRVISSYLHIALVIVVK